MLFHSWKGPFASPFPCPAMQATNSSWHMDAIDATSKIFFEFFAHYWKQFRPVVLLICSTWQHFVHAAKVLGPIRFSPISNHLSPCKFTASPTRVVKWGWRRKRTKVQRERESKRKRGACACGCNSAFGAHLSLSPLHRGPSEWRCRIKKKGKEGKGDSSVSGTLLLISIQCLQLLISSVSWSDIAYSKLNHETKSLPFWPLYLSAWFLSILQSLPN